MDESPLLSNVLLVYLEILEVLEELLIPADLSHSVVLLLWLEALAKDRSDFPGWLRCLFRWLLTCPPFFLG